jgi:hypothetical protein
MIQKTKVNKVKPAFNNKMPQDSSPEVSRIWAGPVLPSVAKPAVARAGPFVSIILQAEQISKIIPL